MKGRASWWYYAICAIGLPAYLWAYQQQARFTNLPADFPPSGFRYPVVWNGQSVGSRAELHFLTQPVDPGAPERVVSAEGRVAAATLPRELTFLGLMVTLISGLFFWAVSTFVFASRARAGPVRDFFWCTFLYGLAIMIGGIHFPGARGWPPVAGSLLQLACLAALPPLFVHLTLSFPRRHPLLDRARGLIPALAAIAAVLVAWQGIAYLRYAQAPGPLRFRALALPQNIADAALTTQVLAGFVILFTAMRRLELERERAQVKWLLWGFAVGVTPYVFLRTLPQLFGIPAPFTPEFDRLLELSIPIAFVFAVVRYQFLDIDIIIRRSVIYASLALLLVAIYLAFVIGIGRSVERLPHGPTLALAIAIGAGAGVMFQPLRGAIGRGVDRTFFKLTHGYGQALGDLRARLARVHAQPDLLRAVDDFVSATLRPAAHAVVLREGGETLGAGNLDAALIPVTAAPAATLAAPNATSVPELESAPFPEPWTRAGIVLAEPLPGEDGPAGYILLGRKRSERRYVEPDLDLVRATATEAGRALERIRLVQRAAQEADARRRAEELDRLKSDFLSRVAHDLRTPLASIVWSTDNLLDGITGELAPAQAEYLRSVKASAAHLNRLVGNLLEISRLEQGRAAIEIAPVDLPAVIEQALLTLRPLAEEKRVALRVETAPGPPVLGNAEKLLEVLLNLVDNAIKFSPPGTVVEIASAPAAGAVELTVRDHGPGLGDSEPRLLFERFRQGSDSPHSRQQGFGLGLYIVKSYLELMRASVVARNHPAGGAIFTCRLPAATDEGGS
jgi:signal transduction histidine kinase